MDATMHTRMPLLMPDDFSDLHLCGWRIEPGEVGPENPLLEGILPWNSGGVGAHSSVFHDPIDGLWKGYLMCTPPETSSKDWHSPWNTPCHGYRHTCYFESNDGVEWRAPELGIYPWKDHQNTNALFDLHEGSSQYSSIMVLEDDPDWQYELFILREPSALAQPFKGYGYYRYRSRDAKTWEYWEGPIVEPMSGDLAFFYRDNGKYVAYYRLALPKQEGDHVPIYEDSARRSVYRAISDDDGSTWKVDENAVLLTADDRDHRDTQYQELVPLKVNGGYIGMITMYLPITQTLNVRLALSRDGQSWWMPDRRPCLPNAPLGDYGGGMIWQSQNLHVIDGHLYLYYGGAEGPHRIIHETRAPGVKIGMDDCIDHGAHFIPFNAALCRANWRFDRVHALCAAAGGPLVGEATTKKQDLAGKPLNVNIKTRPAKKADTPGIDEGHLQVELLDGEEKPIKGFTREDCATLKGDHTDLAVSWKGGDRAPAGAAQARFYLKRTLFYGFEFGDV
jgi:hypothetical protein